MGLQVHQLPPSVPRKWGISVAGKITAGTVRVLSLFAVLLLVFTLHNAQSGHRFTYGDGEGSAVKSSGAPGAHPACECGDWQPWYTDLHRKIVSGDLPPRFLVVTGVESGLADRLTGAIAGFFFALVTRRAFQISTFDPVPGLELVFDPNQSAINWYRPPIDDDIVGPMIFTRMHEYNMTRKMDTHVPQEKHRKEWGYFFQINPDQEDEHTEFGEMDLNFVPKGQHKAENIIFAGNRGQTVALFSNPHHRTQLEELGLSRLTAFTCAWEYLFVPVPAVVERVERWRQELSAPGLLKLGIQVRLGDGEMLDSRPEYNREAYLTKAEYFFKCAEALEKKYNTENRTVIWFLISDSLNLRRAASEKYGAKLLTDTDTAPIHVDCSDGPQILNPCKEHPELRAPAMQSAVADILTFKQTNIHVVTDTSGFGRIGAWLAARRKDIHTISLHPTIGGPNKQIKHWQRDCSLHGPDPIEELGYTWSSF